MNYSEKVMEHFKNPRNVGEIENPSGVGHVGNPTCVLPDTLILCNSEEKPIQSIKEGKMVLGHNGNYHKVIKVYKRHYKGKVYSFRIQSLGRITITPEHHILALKMSHLDRRYSHYKRFKPDWFCAEELEKGDVVLYPIPKESIDKSLMELDIELSKWDFTSKNLPSNISISNDFLRLIGYYLAEGYTRTNMSKGTIGFVFGSDEERYVNDVIEVMKDVFGIIPAPLDKRKNSIGLMFYSAPLARFFSRHFGKGALEKRLPHFMMNLPPEKQKEIIVGMWRGDGCILKNGAKFCTISRQLACQMKHLLMRQKIVFSFLTVPKKGIHKENYHIYVKSIPSMKNLTSIIETNLMLPEKEKDSFKAWYGNDYFYTQVASKKEGFYDGDVFNLEVEKSHSYVSDAFSLHNCGDIMELYIKVENGIITDAKFKTFGCGAAIATSSMVTELVKGKKVEEALKISNKAVAEALGGLPPIKMHCSVLAEEALNSAINDYLAKIK